MKLLGPAAGAAADSADPKEPPTTRTSVCTAEAAGCAPPVKMSLEQVCQ